MIQYTRVGQKTYESETLSHTVRSGPDVSRLYLGRVDLAHNPPGRTICQAEQEDGHDDDPSSNTVRMHSTCSIEGTNQKHDA